MIINYENKKDENAKIATGGDWLKDLSRAFDFRS
jgi:hypothetical protein